MSAETTVTISHMPRGQIITARAPNGEQVFYIDAAPDVALRALADYLVAWSLGTSHPRWRGEL